jgi:hypothetical protein
MTTLFTNSAVDWMRRMNLNDAEKAELFRLMTALNSARSIRDMQAIGLVERVGQYGGAQVYLVGRDPLQVIVTTRDSQPDRFVVTGVHRASENIPKSGLGIAGKELSEALSEIDRSTV